MAAQFNPALPLFRSAPDFSTFIRPEHTNALYDTIKITRVLTTSNGDDASNRFNVAFTKKLLDANGNVKSNVRAINVQVREPLVIGSGQESLDALIADFVKVMQSDAMSALFATGILPTDGSFPVT